MKSWQNVDSMLLCLLSAEHFFFTSLATTIFFSPNLLHHLFTLLCLIDGSWIFNHELLSRPWFNEIRVTCDSIHIDSELWSVIFKTRTCDLKREYAMSLLGNFRLFVKSRKERESARGNFHRPCDEWISLWYARDPLFSQDSLNPQHSIFVNSEHSEISHRL